MTISFPLKKKTELVGINTLIEQLSHTIMASVNGYRPRLNQNGSQFLINEYENFDYHDWLLNIVLFDWSQPFFFMFCTTVYHLSSFKRYLLSANSKKL